MNNSIFLYALLSALNTFLFTFSGFTQNLTMQNGTFTLGTNISCGGTFYDSGGAVGGGAADENFVVSICPQSNQYAQLVFSSVTYNQSGSGANQETFQYSINGGTTWVTINSGSAPTITGSAPGACIMVRYIENGTYATSTNWVASMNCLSHCLVNWSDPDDEYISLVSFGAINQAIGMGSYSNHTSTCYPFVQGSSANLCVSIEMNGNWTNNVHAFFDFNQDGLFETDIDLGNQTNDGTLCSTVTIPCDAVPGSVRMRIVIAEGATEPTACTSGTYGDAADFCLTINAATPPLADAGPDQNITCTSSALLDASASIPSNGFWSLVSGTGTITDPSNPNTTVTGISNGTTIFQWTAIGTCTTVVDEVEIIVSGLPDIPVSAGDDVFTCQPVTLQGSDPSPYTGQWVVTWGANSPTFSDNTAQDSQISGMINGFYTLEWQVNTATCGIISDVMTINYGFLPVPMAGPDQTLCPTGAVLAANEFSGATGTWTIASQPVGSSAGFVDDNDPETLIFGLIPGSYTLNWTVSGGGCPGGTADAMVITVNNCTTAVQQDPVSNQSYTGCNYTYTDDGGAAGNYSANIGQTWTTFCPDDPDAYATLTFSSAFLGPYDYLVVYDDPSPGAPIVGGFWYDLSGGGSFISNPPLGTTITSSTGCLYVQVNTNATNQYAGWQANIGCSSTAGVQNQDFVTVNQCGGGGGITLCASGIIPAISNMDSNPPDLGSANSGCLGSQEGASNTWVYINVESDGYIAFSIDPAGGQDFDYAIWGPYDGGYACPGSTLDDPIRCSWAANGGAGCDAEIGLGVINTLNNPVLPTDVSEGGFCASAYNEGWTYPIDALAGEVYVLLFQNYSFNNSTFDVTINTDPALIPPGANYASLGCTPPQPLPIQLVTFSVQQIDRVNHLYWTTASEYANQLFTIERSDDGKTWSSIINVPGAGFSSETRTYSAMDQSPLQGINYYRLVQTDFDGKKRSYKTIAIASEFLTDDLFGPIYPNPTADEFYFAYGGKDFDTPIQLKVYSFSGQLLIEQTITNFNSSESLNVTTKGLSNGYYHVVIEQNGMRNTKKLLIQN